MAQNDRIRTKIPSDIILQIYKSLHSFADLKALIQTSSEFNQTWLWNVSSITKALLPTITNYLELAEDFLAVQDLQDLNPRPEAGLLCGRVTYEKSFWNRMLSFLVRQRDAIQTRCDVVDDTPAAEIVGYINSMKERVEESLAKLNPKLLTKEEAITIQNKSVADMCLLQHIQRLLAIENKMRDYYEVFSEEMHSILSQALPHRPTELSDEETDRFMKALYKVNILRISNYLKDSTIGQAIKAAVLVRLREKEEGLMHRVNDWQLFVRSCKWEDEVMCLVPQKWDDIRWRPRHNEPWKSKIRCYAKGRLDFNLYTKGLLRFIVDAEWTSALDEAKSGSDSDDFDGMEVDDDEGAIDDSDGPDSSDDDDDDVGDFDSLDDYEGYYDDDEDDEDDDGDDGDDDGDDNNDDDDDGYDDDGVDEAIEDVPPKGGFISEYDYSKQPHGLTPETLKPETTTEQENREMN